MLKPNTLQIACARLAVYLAPNVITRLKIKHYYCYWPEWYAGSSVVLRSALHKAGQALSVNAVTHHKRIIMFNLSKLQLQPVWLTTRQNTAEGVWYIVGRYISKDIWQAIAHRASLVTYPLREVIQRLSRPAYHYLCTIPPYPLQRMYKYAQH